jgi:hypothetical protein
MGSTFQPRFGEDSYPISRLIVERARALDLTRREFVHRLDYRDIGKAHKSLTSALTTGAVPPHMRTHLAGALELDDVLVDAVMAATSQQRQYEWRAKLLVDEKAHVTSFRRHLRSETARTIPEPIFIAALLTTARLRVVPTPEDIWNASPDERDRTLKRAIREHFSQHRGCVPAFGRIVSYTAVVMVGYRSDFGYPYDVDGNPAGPMQQVGRLGEAVFGTNRGDARLTGLLKNTAVTVISAGDDDDPSL